MRPPLHDPRWYAMRAAITMREQLAGERSFALADLEDAMRNGKLATMRRNLSTGAREAVEPAFWHQHEIAVLPITDEAVIVPRGGDRGLPRWDKRDTRHAYFVWKPELDALLGDARGEVSQRGETDAPTPVKPEAKPRPTPKLKHGGGRRRKLSDDQIERGKAFFLNELDRDPGWGEANFRSCCELVRSRFELACSWETVGTWIVKPVLIERGLPAPASAPKNRSKN